MTIVQLRPDTSPAARSEQAHVAVAEDGWEGLAAFRSGSAVDVSPIEAARYAGHLAQVWALLADEAPANRMEVWDAAEELAYDGWGENAEQLLDAARFVVGTHLGLHWPLPAA